MRILFWLALFLMALLQGYWVWVIAIMTWVSYWHSSYWLFLAVVLVDAYYGAFFTVPLLSLAFGAFVLFVETLKMQLLGTNQ